MVNKKSEGINGNNILYHFLQKDLFETDIWLFQMLSARLVANLGIWFHPRLYQQMPVLLPFAVRDPSCRKRKENEEESWGSPDEMGYLRDDNSLIKGLPRSLDIISPNQPLYNGKRIGKGFVASHVWRKINNSAIGAELSTRDPILNSFVPNLVWLPAQVSKLTDREGTFTQLYLQALSAKIYKNLEVPSKLTPFIKKTWDMLEIPKGIPSQGLPEIKDLSFFSPSKQFVSVRRKKIVEVVEALNTIIEGHQLEDKIITTRYGEGLPTLSIDILVDREKELSEYLNYIHN